MPGMIVLPLQSMIIGGRVAKVAHLADRFNAAVFDFDEAVLDDLVAAAGQDAPASQEAMWGGDIEHRFDDFFRSARRVLQA